MSNDVATLSLDSWMPFVTPTESDQTFNQFLSIITSLENSSDTSSWVKWKNFSNQVVIQTPNYFYKLYEEWIYEGFLSCKIREILADIYKEYGLLWNIQTIVQDDKIYQIEQREKLTLCTEEIISYEDLLLNWNQTLIKVEEKLKLDKVLLQLDNISNVKQIKLIRDCINKYEDYAIKDGKTILLDDADWFLALVNKNGDWESNLYKPYDVVTIYGSNFLFAPLNYKSRKYPTANFEYLLNTPNNKWMLFPNIEIKKESCSRLLEKREQLLMNNIKVLSLNKSLGKPQNQYLLPVEINQPKLIDT